MRARIPWKSTLALSLSIAGHAGVFAWLALPRESPVVETAPSPEDHSRGETFEIPTDTVAATDPGQSAAPAAAPPEGVSQRDAVEPKVAPAATAHTPSTASVAPPATSIASSGSSGSTAATAAAQAAPLYGALGDRTASDLATAFTRAFPQAASSDPLWAVAALGPAGSATVTFVLDDAGHLVDATVNPPGRPLSPALRNGIERTLALIRARLFTAPHAIVSLRVSAQVNRDEVHDGLHGDVFAIGGSYTGGTGSAFFALAIGRRIDLDVRATTNSR